MKSLLCVSLLAGPVLLGCGADPLAGPGGGGGGSGLGGSGGQTGSHTTSSDGGGGAGGTTTGTGGSPCTPAEMGRCELQGSGNDCTGVPTEERVFVPIEDGEELHIVVGPQAASMFVLGLRTEGIYPGDVDNPADPDNPDVSITLRSGKQLMAIYHGRPAFVPSAEQPGKLEQAALFVVVDGNGSQLVGMKLGAEAKLVDRDGQERCAEVSFVAALGGKAQ